MPLSALRLMKPGIKDRPQRTLIFVPGSGRYQLPQRRAMILMRLQACAQNGNNGQTVKRVMFESTPELTVGIHPSTDLPAGEGP
jgi:hypothetical protein